MCKPSRNFNKLINGGQYQPLFFSFFRLNTVLSNTFTSISSIPIRQTRHSLII